MFLILPVADTNKATDNCKNEHPAGQGNSQSQGGFGGNRFAALGNNNNQGGAGNRSGAFGSSTFAPPSSLSTGNALSFEVDSASSLQLQRLHFNILARSATSHFALFSCDNHVALHCHLQALLLSTTNCPQPYHCDHEPLATKHELY